jgi:aminopeptidase N
VWRFATIPAKPYELVLAAGPYVTTSGEEIHGAGGPVRLTVRCRPRLAGEPGLARVSGVVRRVVEYYEGLLGVACPYPKYDVVFAPGLGPKAMQLPAVMLVSEELLQQAADPGDDFGTLVLAHEVAHLWFGCLVEGRWWDDLWLAEGMASYLAPLAGQEALSLDAVWAGFSMDDKARACQADQAPGMLPVTSPVADAAAGMSRPAAITYGKAAAVVRQLAALIGDEALRAGLRDYLTRYGGTAATTADLIGCWAQASGRDLGEWAEQWLRTPGVNTLRPELTLGPDGTVASFAVVQEPPPADVAGGGRPVLRTHRIAAGLYDLDDGRLRRRGQVTAEITGARTVLANWPARRRRTRSCSTTATSR